MRKRDNFLFSADDDMSYIQSGSNKWSKLWFAKDMFDADSDTSNANATLKTDDIEYTKQHFSDFFTSTTIDDSIITCPDRRKLRGAFFSMKRPETSTETNPERVLEASKFPSIPRDANMYRKMLNQAYSINEKILTHYCFYIHGTLAYSKKQTFAKLLIELGAQVAPSPGDKVKGASCKDYLFIRGYDENECELFSKNPIFNRYPAFLNNRAFQDIHNKPRGAATNLHIVDEFLTLRFIVDYDQRKSSKSFFKPKKEEDFYMSQLNGEISDILPFFNNSNHVAMSLMLHKYKIGVEKAMNLYLTDESISTQKLFDKNCLENGLHGLQVSYLQISDFLEEDQKKIKDTDIKYNNFISMPSRPGTCWKLLANPKSINNYEPCSLLNRRFADKDNNVFLGEDEVAAYEACNGALPMQVLVKYNRYKYAYYERVDPSIYYLEECPTIGFISAKIAQFVHDMIGEGGVDWCETLYKLTKKNLEANILKKTKVSQDASQKMQKIKVHDLLLTENIFENLRFNKITQKAELCGTFRIFRANVNKGIQKALKQECDHIDVILKVKNPYNKSLAIDEYISYLNQNQILSVVELDKSSNMRHCIVHIKAKDIQHSLRIQVCWHGDSMKYEYFFMRFNQTGTESFNKDCYDKARTKKLRLTKYSLHNDEPCMYFVLVIEFNTDHVKTWLLTQAEYQTFKEQKDVSNYQFTKRQYVAGGMTTEKQQQHRPFWYKDEEKSTELPLFVTHNNRMQHYVYSKKIDLTHEFKYEWIRGEDDKVIFATQWCPIKFCFDTKKLIDANFDAALMKKIDAPIEIDEETRFRAVRRTKFLEATREHQRDEAIMSRINQETNVFTLLTFIS